MSDDRAFLNSLLATPDDAAPWLVYADWLDERGDPRGEYIRLVQSLATKPDKATRRRLNAVRPTLPREWLAVVEQPKLLRANPTPYEAVWSGVGLGDVRPANSTYAGSHYRTLPAIPIDCLVQFNAWAATHTPGPENAWGMREVDRLATATVKKGVRLPDSFAEFFRSGHHRGFARSPTDNVFHLLGTLAAAPNSEARLVRFHSDSQGCLQWYLYLTPEGDSCVVCSPGDNGWPREDGTDVWFCAPTFEEFIVRTWLENVAWFSLHPGYGGENERRWAADPAVQMYLNHYRT